MHNNEPRPTTMTPRERPIPTHSHLLYAVCAFLLFGWYTQVAHYSKAKQHSRRMALIIIILMWFVCWCGLSITVFGVFCTRSVDYISCSKTNATGLPLRITLFQSEDLYLSHREHNTKPYYTSILPLPLRMYCNCVYSDCCSKTFGGLAHTLPPDF